MGGLSRRRAARRARGDAGGPERRKKKRPGGSAQVLDKPRFGQGNPSFSLGWVWPGLAGFGSIWPNLDSAWIFLGCHTLHIGATDLILEFAAGGPSPRCARNLQPRPATGTFVQGGPAQQGSRRMAPTLV